MDRNQDPRDAPTHNLKQAWKCRRMTFDDAQIKKQMLNLAAGSPQKINRLNTN